MLERRQVVRRRISGCRVSGFSLIRAISDIFVEFCVKIHEGCFGFGIEPVQAVGHSLHAVSEDPVCLCNVDEAPCGNNLIAATIVKGVSDRISPIDQFGGELIVLTPSRDQLLLDDFLLNCNGGVFLLHRDRETLEEGFIQDIRSNEATILRALALGVRGCNDGEARCGSHYLIDFLEENRLSLKDRLESHDLVGCEVNLVQ